MDIIDLEPRFESSYFRCLEDWSAEMAEAGDHKARWYARMRDQGLRVKLAVDEQDRAVGMIQYVPSAHSPTVGQGLYHIQCIWVHGYQEGVGNHQGHGVGAQLLQAAEDDARALGALGMSAWGLMVPVFMRVRYFRRRGYRPADRMGMMQLVWKPFDAQASKPKWIRPGRKPLAVPGQVTVTAFTNGWCPAQAVTHERARRAAADLGEPVVFNAIDTSDRETLLHWGISDGLYIDGREARTGPPPTYEQIRQQIEKRLRRLS